MNEYATPAPIAVASDLAALEQNQYNDWSAITRRAITDQMMITTRNKRDAHRLVYEDETVEMLAIKSKHEAEAGGEGDGDENLDAGGRASRHAEQHSQLRVNVPQTWAVEGGRTSLTRCSTWTAVPKCPETLSHQTGEEVCIGEADWT